MPRVRLPRRHKRVNGKLKLHSHYIWWSNTGHWPVWPEVVHHKDGDIMNDEFSNLELKTISEHTRQHHTGMTRTEKAKAKMSDENNPMYGKTGTKHHGWQGDAASDSAKYCREWRRKRRLKKLEERERNELAEGIK